MPPVVPFSWQVKNYHTEESLLTVTQQSQATTMRLVFPH